MPPPRPPPPPPATRKRSNAVTTKGARPPPPQAPAFRRSETDGDEFHDLKRRRSESSRAYAPALRQRANATLKAKTRTRRSAPSGARPSPLHVYVFGYCHREGQRGSRAGYGVYIDGTTPTDTARNVSAPVSLYTKQTSNAASLLAVEAALDTSLVRRASRHDVRVVVHVDDPYTLSMLTYKGAELEAQGYPPRANHLLVARARKAFAHTVRAAKHHPVLLPIDLDDAAQAEGYAHGRRLAKTAVEHLRDTPLAQGGEQEWYYLQNGCAYDDTKRMRLTIPPYDRAYALSKGAWWDWEAREWYTYGPQDLGVHYDMTGVDFRNLMFLYGGGEGTGQPPAGQGV